MCVVAVAAPQSFRAVVDSLLVFHTIPVIMLLALSVRKTEDAAALTEDIIARSGLPKRVVGYHIF